jgi:hypothetical protein
MADAPMPTVLQEVRRRRVGKVVVAYLAVAYLAMEATASFALDLSAAPELLRRIVLGVLVMGFPAAVVLAWTYDLTPRGVVRTPDDDVAPSDADGGGAVGWLVLTAVSVAAGAALRVFRG